MGFSRPIAFALLFGFSATACHRSSYDFEQNPSDDPGGSSIGPKNNAPVSIGGAGSALSDGELASIVTISLRSGIESGALAQARASLDPNMRAIAQRFADADALLKTRADEMFTRIGVVPLTGIGSNGFEQLAMDTQAAFAASTDEDAALTLLEGAIRRSERALELSAPRGMTGNGNGGGNASNTGGNTGNGNGAGSGTGTSSAGADGGIGTGGNGSGDAGFDQMNADGSGNSSDLGTNLENADGGSGSAASDGANGNGSGTSPSAEQIARSQMSTSDGGELGLFLNFFRAELGARMAEARLLRLSLP